MPYVHGYWLLNKIEFYLTKAKASSVDVYVRECMHANPSFAHQLHRVAFFHDCVPVVGMPRVGVVFYVFILYLIRHSTCSGVVD